MNNGQRNIQKEKNWFLLYYPGSKLLPLVAITLLYYLVLRIIFHENFYLTQLLSAMVGALWGFRFERIYRTFEEKFPNWFATYEEYHYFLHSGDGKLAPYTITLIIEIIIIVVFHP